MEAYTVSILGRDTPVEDFLNYPHLCDITEIFFLNLKILAVQIRLLCVHINKDVYGAANHNLKFRILLCGVFGIMHLVLSCITFNDYILLLFHASIEEAVLHATNVIAYLCTIGIICISTSDSENNVEDDHAAANTSHFP